MAFTHLKGLLKRTGAKRVDSGEPIAMLLPMRRGELERFDPIIRELAENQVLDSGHREWCLSRASFNAELRVAGSAAQQKGWQRGYMRGVSVTAARAQEHQTTLRLRDFPITQTVGRDLMPSTETI